MNHKHILLALALGVGGFFAGCAAPQAARIDANRALYNSWPADVQQAVAAGKIEPGMTQQMAEMSWGKPNDIVTQPGSPDTLWIYRTEGYEDGANNPTASDTNVAANTGAVNNGGVGGATTGGPDRMMGIGKVGGQGMKELPLAGREYKGIHFRNGVVLRAQAQ